jgi:hypothetical protein
MLMVLLPVGCILQQLVTCMHPTLGVCSSAEQPKQALLGRLLLLLLLSLLQLLLCDQPCHAPAIQQLMLQQPGVEHPQPPQIVWV